jgi:hypothetical protein
MIEMEGFAPGLAMFYSNGSEEREREEKKMWQESAVALQQGWSCHDEDPKLARFLKMEAGNFVDLVKISMDTASGIGTAHVKNILVSIRKHFTDSMQVCVISINQ